MKIGIIVSCALLMLGATVLVFGISFYLRNRNTPGHSQHYLLFLGLFSSIWCINYGSIGIAENLELASWIRVPGVFAINAFLVVEVFLFSGMSNMRRWVSHLIRTTIVIIAVVDFFMYSDRSVDTFVRIGNWTTWEANPDMAFQHNLHGAFVAVYFLTLLGIGIKWAIDNELKRQRRFIALSFAANFVLIFFCIPDTLLPALGYYSVATSGIGSALCTIVTWYGATQLNAFNIRMGTISRILYDFINAGAMVLATDKRIVMANPYATDRSHGDTLERCHLGDLFVLDENAEEEFFIKALDDKQTMRLNGKKDDRIYSVSLNAAKDDFGDPYCFICVFMDVSAEANAIKELEIANNAKTEFLTSISHEIRTPINAMLGFNEMIMRDAGDDTIVGYANNADRAGRQLLSIVNGLLDMGQIASGKMSIVPEEYNPAVMLSDVYEMQTVKAREKELNLSVFADENTPSILIGDALRIRQIITNLVSNAIKYTNEGSVDLIMECGKRDGDDLDLIIKVTDTGIGIKEESIPYLYDTFTRFDKEANKHIEGTGVGLSVTKNLVDMMDGTIDVKSVYGEGTTFTVVLPQKIMDSEPIGKIEDYISRREEVKSESFIAPRASLLVVDDNEMNLSVFSGLVSPIKADVDEALSGAEMLELIKKKKYHIIFLDHMMPEMDGVETLEKMKEDSSHLNTDTPVIVMTANAGVGAKDKYVKMGFDDYLSKPTRSEKLLGLIKSYLDDELIDEAEEPETVQKTDDEELPEHAFPDVPGIDWKAACMNVPKKEALFDIMGKFCSLADREIAALDDHYMQSMMNGDEDALDLYRIKVHSMKNSAALIGANDLATKAKRLEDAPDKRDFVTINRFHKTFIKEYRTMADNLEAIVLKTSSSDIPVMDDDALKEKLDILEKAMEEFDTMTLNRVMFELSEYSFSSKEVENAAEDLGKAVRDFDTVLFENTMETMRSLIQA